MRGGHGFTSQRGSEDARFLEHSRAFHRASRVTYGAPRILRDPGAAGVRVGRKPVARLLTQAGLQGVSRRKWPATTVRDGPGPLRPDLVQRNLRAHRAGSRSPTLVTSRSRPERSIWRWSSMSGVPCAKCVVVAAERAAGAAGDGRCNATRTGGLGSGNAGADRSSAPAFPDPNRVYQPTAPEAPLRPWQPLR